LRVNGASLGAARFSWVTLGWKPKWKPVCVRGPARSGQLPRWADFPGYSQSKVRTAGRASPSAYDCRGRGVLAPARRLKRRNPEILAQPATNPYRKRAANRGPLQTIKKQRLFPALIHPPHALRVRRGMDHGAATLLFGSSVIPL
jgi:hypothetical protein